MVPMCAASRTLQEAADQTITGSGICRPEGSTVLCRYFDPSEAMERVDFFAPVLGAEDTSSSKWTLVERAPWATLFLSCIIQLDPFNLLSASFARDVPST